MSSERKYNRVSAVVDEWLFDNDLTSHWFAKGLSRALRGLKELKLDIQNTPKTVLLTVTDRKTVTLPGDYTKWTKVGIKVGQYCITMGVNDDLTTQSRTDGDQTIRGLLSQNLPNGTDIGGYTFFNFGGSDIFGIGNGMPSKGYFKEHDNGNCVELLLDYDYGYPEVYVEYISSGIDPCGDTVVHPFLQDYVLKYIEAKYEEKNNPKASEASIDRKWRDVHWAEVKARARNNDLDPKTLLNITRANNRLTLKT